MAMKLITSAVAGVGSAIFIGSMFVVAKGVFWSVIPPVVLALLCFAFVYGVLSLVEDYFESTLDFVMNPVVSIYKAGDSVVDKVMSWF